MIKTSLHEPTRVGSLNLSDPELTNTPPNLVRSVLNPTSKNTVCAFRGLFRTHATFLFKCRGIYPRTDKPNLQRGAFSQCSVLSHTRRRCPVTRRKSMKNILPAKIFNRSAGNNREKLAPHCPFRGIVWKISKTHHKGTCSHIKLAVKRIAKLICTTHQINRKQIFTSLLRVYYPHIIPAIGCTEEPESHSNPPMWLSPAHKANKPTNQCVRGNPQVNLFGEYWSSTF